jgi:hypothetical protein
MCLFVYRFVRVQNFPDPECTTVQLGRGTGRRRDEKEIGLRREDRREGVRWNRKGRWRGKEEGGMKRQ